MDLQHAAAVGCGDSYLILGGLAPSPRPAPAAEARPDASARALAAPGLAGAGWEEAAGSEARGSPAAAPSSSIFLLDCARNTWREVPLAMAGGGAGGGASGGASGGAGGGTAPTAARAGHACCFHGGALWVFGGTAEGDPSGWRPAGEERALGVAAGLLLCVDPLGCAPPAPPDDAAGGFTMAGSLSRGGSRFQTPQAERGTLDAVRKPLKLSLSLPFSPSLSFLLP